MTCFLYCPMTIGHEGVSFNTREQTIFFYEKIFGAAITEVEELE